MQAGHNIEVSAHTPDMNPLDKADPSSSSLISLLDHKLLILLCTPPPTLQHSA